MFDFALRNIYKVGFFVLGMRLILVLLLGLFLVGVVGAIVPDDCDLEERMIAYWRMESNLEDSFGGHDAGTWVGTARYAPAIGYGAGFEGVESVSISGVNDLDFAFAFSIEFLINSDSSPDAILFEKGEYKIEWVNGVGVVANVDDVSVSSGVLGDGINYHVALVWEPVSTDLILYINGVSVDTASLSMSASAVGSLIIGDGFNGWIDEVAVYDSAFSQETVNYHRALLSVDKDYCDPSGVGGASTSKSDFNIAGCTLPGGDGLTRASCSIDGEYYCDEDEAVYATRTEQYGCSLGEVGYTPGDDYCCPSGLYCNGTFVCDQRVEQCNEQFTESDCEEIGCLWLDDEGLCVDSTSDYSCSIYQTLENCEEDIWNLAKQGVGTEICGMYIVVDNIGYVIPYDSCSCEWDETEADPEFMCKLGYDVYPDVYGANPDWFKCLKAFDIGECIDGVQDFSWVISSVNATGVFDITSPNWNVTLYENVAEAAGCATGDSVRNCGEPVIRLPGFSLFAFFVSVFIISLFYFLKLVRFK